MWHVKRAGARVPNRTTQSKRLRSVRAKGIPKGEVMKALRFYPGLVVLALTFWSVASAADEPGPKELIVGTWKGDADNSKNGYEFNKDGDVGVHILGAAEIGPYRGKYQWLDENTLEWQIGGGKFKYTVTVTKDTLVLKEPRKGGTEFKLARVSNDAPGLVVVKKKSDSTSNKTSKTAKTDAATEKPKIEEPTAGKKGKWVVLFRSADPTLWNKDVQSSSVAYAVPIRRAPDDLRFLKLVYLPRQKKDKDFVIVPISKARLLAQSEDSKAGWNGLNELKYRAYHLGVYTTSPGTQAKGDIEVINPSPGNSVKSYGFGNRSHVDDRQGYAWAGAEVQPAIFEIAVTTGALTDDEAKKLLTGE
jgi:hypothetical protein